MNAANHGSRGTEIVSLLINNLFDGTECNLNKCLGDTNLGAANAGGPGCPLEQPVQAR